MATEDAIRQGNRKTIKGKQHLDRNAQFEYINVRVTAEMHDDFHGDWNYTIRPRRKNDLIQLFRRRT